MRSQGHRLLPHTADCVLEAWGPTRTSCLEEAVLALVESFADVSDVPAARPVPVSVGPAADDDLAVLLLEEVIYAADVLGVVPVTVKLADTDDGGIFGIFDAAPVGAVKVVGPAPKGVSHQVAFAEEDGRWRCLATVDV